MLRNSEFGRKLIAKERSPAVSVGASSSATHTGTNVKSPSVVLRRLRVAAFLVSDQGLERRPAFVAVSGRHRLVGRAPWRQNPPARRSP